MPDWFGVAIAFVFGTVVGSFLNVCIWRLPRGESLVSPGSHCPHCNALLRPWDLVPLLSFLIQRARCRYCKGPITWRYFGVELLTGVFFVLVFLKFGWAYNTIFYALFVAALIAVFFIDLEHLVIPDEISLFVILLGIAKDVTAAVTGGEWLYRIGIPFTGAQFPFPYSVAGILICGLAFAAIAIGAYYLFQKEGLGGGDIKLAAGVGAVLGTGQAMLSFFFAVLLGSVIGVALIAAGKKGKQDLIPFGPMMVAGAVIALFFGPEVWGWYKGFAGL